MNYITVIVYELLLVCTCLARNTPAAGGGGMSLTNVKGTQVRALAKFAVSELGRDYTLVTVNAARVQVSVGLSYLLDIVVAKENGNGQPITTRDCKVEVLDQAWMNVKEVTMFLCRRVIVRIGKTKG